MTSEQTSYIPLCQGREALGVVGAASTICRSGWHVRLPCVAAALHTHTLQNILQPLHLCSSQETRVQPLALLSSGPGYSDVMRTSRTQKCPWEHLHQGHCNGASDLYKRARHCRQLQQAQDGVGVGTPQGTALWQLPFDSLTHTHIVASAPANGYCSFIVLAGAKHYCKQRCRRHSQSPRTCTA